MSGAIRVCTAPGTWGVEAVSGPTQPPWGLFLDDVAAAGFDGIELGPFGYLPSDPERLRSELSARGLKLSAGFVMEPFHNSTHTASIIEEAQRTCELLAAAGATTLMVLGSLVPERSAAAGRPDAAPPLTGSDRNVFIRTMEAVIDSATELGLRTALHPHAGTYVEFEHEIEDMLEASSRLGLCIDTGHCLYSGVDPIAFVEKHIDRVVHVHLKDLRAELSHDAVVNGLSFEQAVTSDVFCVLGDGNCDLVGFIGTLRRLGYDGWATYELERVASEYLQARGDADRSLAYLRALGVHDPPQRV